MASGVIVNSTSSADGQSLIERVREDQLWYNIRRKAKVHPALQEELDRVIMFYKLIDHKNDNR